MKKVLSLVLAVVLVLGMSTVAFAAYPTDKPSVEDVQKSSKKLLELYASNNNAAISTDDSYRIEDTIKVTAESADAELFSYNVTGSALTSPSLTDGTAKSAFASGTDYIGVYIKDGSSFVPLVFADVKKYDIGVKLASTSTVFKGVSLKDGGGYAVVRFQLYPYLDSSSAKSFTDKIYLTADGKKMTGTELEIKGKFENNGTDLTDEDENEIDLTSPANRKLNVKANVRNAEIELDYDVFLYTTLYNGRNVYARATNIADNTQFAVMDKYTAIEESVTLYTAGLTSTTKVFFDRPEKLYVYGVDSSASYDAVADTVKLVYLGTTSEKLPLVDQYFLSTKELAIETTPVEPEPSVPAESSVSNPVGGGDTTAPNANYNPGTGC